MSSVVTEDDGGLFSHDEIYTFYADAFPIYTENSLSENVRNALLDAVSYAVAKESDIAEEILKIKNGLKGGAFLDNYFSYGKNRHPFGLPSATRTAFYKGAKPSIGELKAVISTHFSIPVDTIEIVSDYFISSFYVSRNEIIKYSILVYLEYNIEFNIFTFVVNPLKVSTVLGIVWQHPDAYLLASTVKLIKMEDISYAVLGAVVNKKLTFEISHPTYGITIQEHSFAYNSQSINSDLEIISFRVNGVSDYYGQSEFTFVYPFSESYRVYEYSSLNPEIPNEEIIEDVYPILPIKIFGKEVNSEFSTTLFEGKTLQEYSKEMAKALGLDLNQLIDGLKTGNNNYTGTHTAYLFLGVNLNSKNNTELAYVFDYFLGKGANGDSVSITRTFNPTFNIATTLQDIFGNADVFKIKEEGILDNPLGETYHRTFKVSGVHAYAIPGNMEDYPITNSSPNALNFVRKIRDVPARNNQNAFRISVQNILLPSPIGGAPIEKFCYVLDRQVSENEWLRLVLIDPMTTVYGGRDYQRKVYITANINELFEEDGNELRIPLQRSKLFEFTAEEQEEIALRSICIQIVYRNRDSVSWYKTDQFYGFLNFVLTAVAFTLTVISLGTLSWTNVLTSLLISVTAPAILKLIFEALEPLIGKDVAAAVTIVVAVVGMAYGFDMDTTSTALTALNMTTAVSNIHTNFTMEQIEELQKENALLDTRVEDLLETMEKIQEGLIPGELSSFALGLLSKKDDIVYESPSEFFFRTIHVGNPGVRTLNYPMTYHRKALELPDLLEEDI